MLMAAKSLAIPPTISPAFFQPRADRIALVIFFPGVFCIGV